MANLEAQPDWPAIRQLETHELARGGINGNMNEQAKALVARTEFLNKEKASKAEIVQGVFEFETYAEFNAVKATLPMNCTVVLNQKNTGIGHWDIGNNRWDGLELKKSSYDPVEQSKIYIDQELLQKVLAFFRALNAGKNLFNVLDQNENSAFFINENGEVFVYGHNYSIQEILSSLENKTDPLLNIKGSKEVFAVYDGNEIQVLKVADDGQLYISGLTDSVQSLLNNVNKEPKAEKKSVQVFKKNIVSHSQYLQKFTHLLMARTEIAPVPHFSYFQQFSLGVNWIDAIRMNLSAERIIIGGYDPTLREDIGVVHPQVWSFDKEVAGFKYWMGINPYTNTNENIELPFIYGSNDPELKTWELIPGFPTPFDVDPPNVDGVTSGHISDSGFVYDIKTGDLVFFWRRTRYRGNRDIFTATNEFMASRYDGKAWSEIFVLFPEHLVIENGVTDYKLSPNIVYNHNDDLYYMYTFNYSDAKLRFRTTNDLASATWSEPTECVLTPGTGFNPWHLDMKFVGDKLVALIHVDTANANQFRFAVSDDFINFRVSASNIVNDVNPDLYKATFLPLLEKDVFKMRVVYTTDAGTTPNWQLHVADTTTVNITDGV